MMTHPEHDLLSAYADGELDVAERRAVDAHLSTCGDARDLLDAIRATLADFAAMEPVEMDPQVGFAIRSAVARERKLTSRSRRYAWAGAAAAAALVGVMSFAVLGGNNDPAADSGAGAALSAGPELMLTEDLDEDRALRVLETYVQDNYAFPEAASGMGGDAMETTRVEVAPPAPAMQAYAGLTDASTFAECIRTIERESDSVRLVRSIAATYKGEAVYVLLFVIPAERPDRVEMWITARDSCETRYFSQANVNR